jgi:SAM-dependent methyltransferase
VRDRAPQSLTWILDERAGAGRENLDAVHVSRYDAKEDGDARGEVRLLQSLGLDETSTVLDVGAGTGQFTIAVAPFCTRVVAADVSPTMQRRLRDKVEASSQRRFMRPEAVFRLWDVVYSFEPSETEERIESWCATGGSDAATDWSRAELEEHVRDEHSTFTWLLEPIIERAGFRIDVADYSLDGIFARYVIRRP